MRFRLLSEAGKLAHAASVYHGHNENYTFDVMEN